MALGINQMHAAILAVIELETKLHFMLNPCRDHEGSCSFTQADCDGARVSVEAASHVLSSTVHHALLFRIEGVQRWLASRDTQAKG